MPNYFSDRHRFFLLTNNTVVHKYNIHNHIPRQYGHQLGSNLNFSLVPVFHGSRTSPNQNNSAKLPKTTEQISSLFGTYIISIAGFRTWVRERILSKQTTNHTEDGEETRSWPEQGRLNIYFVSNHKKINYINFLRLKQRKLTFWHLPYLLVIPSL